MAEMVNYWYRHLTTTVRCKNMSLLSLFVFSKTIIPGILWVGTRNSERLMWENNTFRNNACKIIGRLFRTRRNEG
jgi:hypothetical protein